jgi:CRP-like cAMP-binding protein
MQNDVIMQFLQQESKFKTYFPQGTLFSKKDVETIRDGCRLKVASRNDVLSKSGEFIDDIYVVICGFIALENPSSGRCSYREVHSPSI